MKQVPQEVNMKRRRHRGKKNKHQQGFSQEGRTSSIQEFSSGPFSLSNADRGADELQLNTIHMRGVACNSAGVYICMKTCTMKSMSRSTVVGVV
ncbi:LOW QUALITY PROTEIN: hypothetical protein NC653_020556 [Populus alba x Populus x berolinensis]|uniref:Uncharacterized protein n=1 Tax=Populus alba x Populus x berolinensis TaxID=444605 RepID=A0AAD6MKP8_9ROSI|nr:LOW QUALITY PROTEIN: hypothetical protein NC653_020556 [Populus alba x Populus x berolinensis]